jgi:hypothetical protein
MPGQTASLTGGSFHVTPDQPEISRHPLQPMKLISTFAAVTFGLALASCDHSDVDKAKDSAAKAADSAKEASKDLAESAKKAGDVIAEKSKVGLEKAKEATAEGTEAAKEGYEKAKEKTADGLEKAAEKLRESGK